jgi:ParB-like nuclease domain
VVHFYAGEFRSALDHLEQGFALYDVKAHATHSLRYEDDPGETCWAYAARTLWTLGYARNPRTHTDAQVAQIAASICEFGWTTPVLVDDANGIIAGHGRVLAARKLGLERVPVIQLAYMTEAQKRAYVLADNQLALSAGWDEALLRLELADCRSSASTSG